MQNFTIGLVTPAGDIINMTFDPTNNVIQLYQAVSKKINVNEKNFALNFDGKPMNQMYNNLYQYGVKDGDLLQVQINQPVPQQNTNQFAGLFGNLQQQQQQTNQLVEMQEAITLQERYKNNSSELNMLFERDPEMAQAVLNDDVQVTIEFIRKRKQAKQQEKIRRQQYEARLQRDPFDAEAQKEIEKIIREERMNQEIEWAHENMPESFVQTTMLYIPMAANGKNFQAFVDSGAQSTIMSKAFAEQLGLMKDVDTRYQGTAVGVGTTKIIGRIHRCRLQVAGNMIECSIQVLDQGQSLQMLFGLDMLKKHRCCINLQDNTLEFRALDFKVEFVKDHQIKEGHIW